jgi:UDP-glucose/iron transport system permease protein
MNGTVTEISTTGLALALLPALVAIAVMYHWKAGAASAVYATLRMLAQLLLIGYVLIYIFRTDHAGVILLVLVVMVSAASWISIRHLHAKTPGAYARAFCAISLPSAATLVLVTQAVIGVQPWFSPRYVVPLAGMIIAGAMNAVGLAAERLQAETANGRPYPEARRTALQASLIPVINSLFAVGLVSLPGMMTGQILSGVSPLVAAKYQIVVMTMLFGTAGTASSLYLSLQKSRLSPGS